VELTLVCPRISQTETAPSSPTEKQWLS
jgi:hypothetical protein